MEPISVQAECGVAPRMASAGSGPTPDSIAARQNLPANIDLLAAQRQLYSEAKNWRRVRAWSVIAMAGIGVLAPILVPEFVRVIAAVGAAVAVIQWVVGDFEKQRVKLAATIQEQFDTTVYLLNWNPLLGSKVDVEDSVAAARRFKGNRGDLLNWYRLPPDVPRPLDVLLCQRSNLRWDAALRRAYGNTLTLGLVALFLLFVAVAILRDLSSTDSVLSLVPMVSALLFGLETIRSHRCHSTAQIALKGKVEAAYEKARTRLRSVSNTELRSIQDGIHGLRVAAPTIPDGFYRKRRQQYEEEMQQAMDRLWTEFKTSKL